MNVTIKLCTSVLFDDNNNKIKAIAAVWIADHNKFFLQFTLNWQ